MNRQKLFNGLQFYNNKIIRKNVYSITAVQLNSLINNRQRYLSAKGNLVLRKFVTKALFISRF